MQTVLLRIVFVITCFLASLAMQAQVSIKKERYNATIDSLRVARQHVEKEEKDKLKLGIEALQEKLKEEKITITEFEDEKKNLAEKHAKNISSRILIIDESIEYLKRNDGEQVNQSITISLERRGVNRYNENARDTTTRYAVKQSSGIFMAAGFSNTIGDDHNLDDTPYKMAGSRFFEIGYHWRTAFKENSPFHLRYGIGLHIDGYKPSSNRYFVMKDNELHLEEHALKLKKSKLRTTNLVVPVHFEFSKPKLKTLANGRKIYSNWQSWNIGIGGYAGMNLKTIQKLKYKEEGSRQKTKENMSDGINQAVYGLSAYVGKGAFSLYGRYALSDMFKGDLRSENTLAIGLRYAH